MLLPLYELRSRPRLRKPLRASDKSPGRFPPFRPSSYSLTRAPQAVDDTRTQPATRPKGAGTPFPFPSHISSLSAEGKLFQSIHNKKKKSTDDGFTHAIRRSAPNFPSASGLSGASDPSPLLDADRIAAAVVVDWWLGLELQEDGEPRRRGGRWI